MPVDLRETRLPGVGVKYVPTANGGRLAVILHIDGQGEIYLPSRRRRRAEHRDRAP